MKITPEAKLIIDEALIANKSDCLLVQVQESCCGEQMNFALGTAKETDRIVSVDGISVVMDDEIQKKLESVTINADKGQLFIHDTNASNCEC
jgi:Fe-S cluster assembly iron-binding protein IscA